MLHELNLFGRDDLHGLSAMRAIYKVHNGQDIRFDQECQDGTPGGDTAGVFQGMFGG